MEKTVTLNKYETVVIVDARLNTEEKEALLKEAIDIITKSGGKIINSQVWIERQKFTFNIKKVSEGTYYLIAFESDSTNITKMNSLFKLNERILRSAITKL